ncbi:MAG: hypothetical protein KatS3mg131_3769 [Candidatus Tectimicrobiota bacterium]|nr:MAG: hypothetical protein KatS3mg131_3769 [Candidatus Tectomicrobia bacterium]
MRYAVGLMANQHFLGLMTLSARLTGEPFTPEDTELLKTIADQTAASLLNLQLSERLARSKQLDTLRTMAAFFVHDLKNFAARLSLLMENFETHYHDAAFRAEALRLMRTSVAKMQHMCSRLSLLTARLELRRTATDVNALVRDTVAELRGALSAPVVLELQPLPPAWLDAEQLQKVLVNLLLNANDAVAGQGEIRVRTWQEGGYVVLAVSDNGCGIPAAFLKASLFQPFQTTKRGGLGIGLFHSKMIVEAHRGRIEVESEEGKGSTFRVWLPLATPEEESRDVGQDPAC